MADIVRSAISSAKGDPDTIVGAQKNAASKAVSDPASVANTASPVVSTAEKVLGNIKTNIPGQAISEATAVSGGPKGRNKPRTILGTLGGGTEKLGGV